MLDDDTPCYRHADRRAAVSCQRCERPICTECMTQASVGFHCPECAKSGAQQVVRARDLSQRPRLLTGLIITNVVVFLAQRVELGEPWGALSTWGLLFGPAVRDGEWWRVVTSGFLHADLLHLGFNMYALWLLGPPVERIVGTARFGIIYLAGLLGGAAAVSLFDFTSPTLGASGAVLGLAGGLMALLMARGIKFTQTSLAPIVLINLLLPLAVSRISFWGHFGGVVAGFFAAWMLTQLAERQRAAAGQGGLRSPETSSIVAGVVLCAGLFALSVAGPIALGN